MYRAAISPATADKNDFNVLSSTELNFRPGVTTDRIVIEAIDDSINEDDEVLIVTLSTANTNVEIDKSKEITTITIIDNDGKCMLCISICSVQLKTREKFISVSLNLELST